MRNYLCLFILLLCKYFLYSQEISGIVYDKATNSFLPGASVYLDGTTIGTTTDYNGFFDLNLKKSQNALIIVSFIGYKSQSFYSSEFNSLKKIYLEENTNQLNEVELGLDIWSRKKKLQIFKSEFLGHSYLSKKCKILNEKDIFLIYNSSLNTLTAYSEKPIVIKNHYLGYEIIYNLIDFEIEFSNTSSGLRLTNKVYYAGTSFFKELRKKTKSKIKLRRKLEYKGSLLHFMRSLSAKKLTENNFKLFFKRFPIYPYKHFIITKENKLTKVEMTVEKLSVLYNNSEQSSFESLLSEKNTIFYIDEYGNHSPPNNLLFGGVFGRKRISNLLPLNYILTKE